jgi:hypothetical protein
MYPRSHFDTIVQEMLQKYQLIVKKWRKTMSGCAWAERHVDGKVERFIESPYPKAPISLAIFLHEVGHHVIGFYKYKRRCEDEYHAWVWAIQQMRLVGVEPDWRVWQRFDHSMLYAVYKATRRGLKEFPPVIVQFLEAPSAEAHLSSTAA